MKPGTYGVVASRGFVPFGIRAFTRSWADHAFVYVGDGKIIEAMPEGVVISDLAKYDGCRIEYSSDDMTDAQREAAVSTAESLLGWRYNFADILALAVQCLGLTVPTLFEIASVDQRSTICSQLVVMCGQEAGVDWLCGKTRPLLVTPADLAARLN